MTRDRDEKKLAKEANALKNIAESPESWRWDRESELMAKTLEVVKLVFGDEADVVANPY